MNNLFDIVIATLNRPKQVFDLIVQIQRCTLRPQRIIIVDSSENADSGVYDFSNVVYIKSSHKNQPYQRYLGFKASKEQIVIFFDDDIIIRDERIFQYFLERFNDPDVVGATSNFLDDGSHAIDVAMGTVNKTRIKEKYILQKLWILTGAPRIKSNSIWLAGLRGPFDASKSYTEVFAGPGGLAFRREITEELFDNLLFTLYEKELGKGEDKYISMKAVSYGKLAFIGNACLVHPSHPSHYFQNLASFSKREILSRYVLSRRYAEIKKKPIWLVNAHFFYYAFWRILISFTKFLIRPTSSNYQMLRGKLKGIIAVIITPFFGKQFIHQINWEKEIMLDLSNSI